MLVFFSNIDLFINPTIHSNQIFDNGITITIYSIFFDTTTQWFYIVFPYVFRQYKWNLIFFFD